MRLHNADRCSEEREGREEREGMNVWREEEYIGTMGLKKKKKKRHMKKGKNALRPERRVRVGKETKQKH